MARKLLLLTLLLAASTGTPAQAPQKTPPSKAPAQRPGVPPQDDPRARIRTTVELVVVPVTVKDSRGNPVLDVRREEFRVFEDGVEQEIALFSVDPFPLSVVLLIDNSLPRKVAQDVERSVATVAAGLSEADETTVLLFDEFPAPADEFTKDNDRIYSQLKRLKLNQEFPGRGSGPMTSGPRINSAPQSTGVPQVAGRERRGNKNLDDAVYAAGQLLRQAGRERRKIIFLISDGKNSRNNTVSFDDTLKLLLSADISVYAIGVGDAVLSRGVNALARYAHSTGGDVFYAGARSELEGLYSRVTEQARNQYTLAYVPHNPDRTREYHEIEVKVRRPDLTLQARDGYFTVAP